jgi:hypothetical protein
MTCRCTHPEARLLGWRSEPVRRLWRAQSSGARRAPGRALPAPPATRSSSPAASHTLACPVQVPLTLRRPQPRPAPPLQPPPAQPRPAPPPPPRPTLVANPAAGRAPRVGAFGPSRRAGAVCARPPRVQHARQGAAHPCARFGARIWRVVRVWRARAPSWRVGALCGHAAAHCGSGVAGFRGRRSRRLPAKSRATDRRPPTPQTPTRCRQT